MQLRDVHGYRKTRWSILWGHQGCGFSIPSAFQQSFVQVGRCLQSSVLKPPTWNSVENAQLYLWGDKSEKLCSQGFRKNANYRAYQAYRESRSWLAAQLMGTTCSPAVKANQTCRRSIPGADWTAWLTRKLKLRSSLVTPRSGWTSQPTENH